MFRCAASAAAEAGMTSRRTRFPVLKVIPKCKALSLILCSLGRSGAEKLLWSAPYSQLRVSGLGPRYTFRAQLRDIRHIR